MRRKATSYIGTKINYITITGIKKIKNRAYFICHCDCGAELIVRTDNITSGKTKSCGCMKGDIISRINVLPNNQAAINSVYAFYFAGAKKRSLAFTLSLDDFKSLIFGDCVYCGIVPQPKTFSRKYCRNDLHLSYNGIDRIDSSKGYTLLNCVSCCSICNIAKSDLSLDEFRNWIHRVASNLSK